MFSFLKRVFMAFRHGIYTIILVEAEIHIHQLKNFNVLVNFFFIYTHEASYLISCEACVFKVFALKIFLNRDYSLPSHLPHLKRCL